MCDLVQRVAVKPPESSDRSCRLATRMTSRTQAPAGRLSRAVAIAACLAVGTATAAHATPHDGGATHRAHAAIVAGTEILVAGAPWQVAIQAVFKTPSGQEQGILCSGALIDTTHVLTAAHCVFIAPEERIPASDFLVKAGSSNLKAPEPGEQVIGVSNVRAHPYYTYEPDSERTNPDDVAVLTLAQPVVTGPDVSPIELAPLGVYPPVGTTVGLTGFGEQNPTTKELDGKLYSLSMTLESGQGCGGKNDAVIICASSPSGSSCNGDSGSVMTLQAGTPMAIGVVNTGVVIAGQTCAVGSQHSLANLAAPEIQDFVEGSETPPRAPRAGEPSCPEGQPTVGVAFTCKPGRWSGAALFDYVFSDTSSDKVLQSGPSPSYKPTVGSVGRSIVLEVQATNAGGTATARAPATEIVRAGPSAPVSGDVSIAHATIAVGSSGVAIVKLHCTEPSGCRGSLTLSMTARSKVHGHLSAKVKVAQAGFSIAARRTQSIELRLNSVGRHLLRSARRSLSASLGITQPRLTKVLTVHLWATATERP